MILPEVDDLLSRVHVAAIPMRVRFRGITVREVALIDGPAGWGEFGPFPEYASEEAAAWLAGAVEAAYAEWPTPRRALIPVNATVPAVPAAAVAKVLARFPGTTTAKVKVAEPGQTLADDVRRVAAVRGALGPGGRVRVDANGGWSVRAAVTALAALARTTWSMPSSPAPRWRNSPTSEEALAAHGIGVSIAADESIRKAADPLRVARLGACDLIVVKVAPLGGVRRALDLVLATGLPAVVSSALDTSVGIAAGIALAAALPDLPYACGLGTVALLDGDVASPSLLPASGLIPVGAVSADPELLQRHTATKERRDWWLGRIRECHAVLSGKGADDRLG